MSDAIGSGIARSQDTNIRIPPILTIDTEVLDKDHDGLALPIPSLRELQRHRHALTWRENASVNAVYVPLFPQSTTFKAVAKEALMPDPWISMSVFWRMLQGIPSVERLIARTHDWGLRIWIIVNNSTEDVRYQIYNKEWELMQRFPGLGVTFELIDREDRPLEQLMTLEDVDVQFTFRELAHATRECAQASGRTQQAVPRLA